MSSNATKPPPKKGRAKRQQSPAVRLSSPVSMHDWASSRWPGTTEIVNILREAMYSPGIQNPISVTTMVQMALTNYLATCHNDEKLKFPLIAHVKGDYGFEPASAVEFESVVVWRAYLSYVILLVLHHPRETLDDAFSRAINKFGLRIVSLANE